MQKLNTNNLSHEKTSKYTEGNAVRAKTGLLNRKKFYTNRGRENNEFRKMLLF